MILKTFLLSTIGSHGTKHKQVTCVELCHLVLLSLQYRMETIIVILVVSCYEKKTSRPFS